MNNSSWGGSREHVVHGEVGKEYNKVAVVERSCRGEERESSGEGLKG
jgi:hypothetical protein